MKLSQDFYLRDTRDVARDLLGKYLVQMQGDTPLVVRICETEAYIGPIDKACHAYNYRRTPRTETLFAPPGTAYVYLIYGMHHCLNFVTEPEGTPCAVLIRGAKARAGLEELALNRYGKPLSALTRPQKRQFLNGPGKLCKALAITREDNGRSLLGETLFVCDRLEDVGLVTPPEDAQSFVVRQTPRIGIDYAEEAVYFPWRYLF
ncbi:MAG: DNA-3-methyladenine glycosylase [Evtepia sp.]|uniref:DNA-3-methyladenine glycosylase n=1 Tax=Evtepia sp. TaxID=2773933 RepID=UPI002A766A94|nr:DNA-3-methyladenine glycosylase [Evtepia sp.]MDY3014023.1 DNA-3-methyladenine glycosylase [Evtepia sp.]